MSKDNQNHTGKGKIAIPEVYFQRKQPKQDKPSLIRAIFRYRLNGSECKLVYSTKHKIKKTSWSSKTQRPRSNYKFKDELNDDLDNIINAIESVFKKYGKITIKKFRFYLDKDLGRSKKDETREVTDFLSFIDDYVERKSSNNELSENTIKKYVTVRNKLFDFSEFRSVPVDFNDITLSFKDHFLNWMYEHTSTKSANTANKDFATIKQLLKLAYKEDYHSNLIFNDNDFGVKRSKTSKIALTEDELDKLFELKIKPHKKLKEKKISVELAEKVRDWFLVAAYSSLRWSDFTNISPESIVDLSGDLFIHTWTKKTNEEVYIPINERLLSILKKYNYTSPEMTSQRFNEAIKVVCDIAGINQKVIINRNVKGKPTPETIRKCDKISSHDGRRTWASINYSNGFPILLLMQVTAHQKETTFLSYIGISKKELAIKLKAQMKSLKESKLRAV